MNNYTYSADGKKLKIEMKFDNQTKITDYVGNMIYENGALKRILVDGGYIENNKYHFFIQDHLGNNRVMAKADGTVIQTNHYYPFRMTFMEDETHDAKAQPYKYNGKEFDGERGLNLYDYLARSMDPAEGRFTSVDPLAEKYYSISPYAYCGNNPMRFIDPDGRDWYRRTDEFGNEHEMWSRSEQKTYKDSKGNIWKNIGKNLLYIFGDNAILFTQYKNKNRELSLKSSSYDTSNKKSASKLISRLTDILGKGSSVTGTVGYFSKKSLATFRSINSKGTLDFKLYKNGWKGNQWTKTQPISKAGSTLLKATNYVNYIGLGLTVYQLGNSSTLEDGLENSLDLLMCGIGFCPTIGLPISAFWSFGGKQLHSIWRDKVLMPQIKMGVEGYASTQPFK